MDSLFATSVSLRCNHGREPSATCPVCESVLRSERHEEFDLSLIPDDAETAAIERNREFYNILRRLR